MKTPRQRTARAGTGAAPVPGTRIVEPEIDGHDRGANAVARTPRPTGYEVIGIDPHRAPEQILVGDIIPDVGIPTPKATDIHAVSPGADMSQILETTDRLYAAPNQTLEPTC
ncbi:hypothetical protein [Streptomyces rugosispiralis]|uniref:Uncharacterized protein n=1 Tax=Streptomyces rugosispiralis TaxID=2967341 RepID=A0ABT1VE93_9ACTN|nr:hypothetical protein [Streptomyces rugosispiralis]MCQ8195622.1 hypothetical protein [Streptomyces rugosispiralis]